MKIKLKDITGLIEYKGELISPEELAKILNVTMDYEITL